MAKHSADRGGATGHGLDSEVERALNSSHTLDARELIELIHRVNPSMQSMPQAQMRKRYQQKSALQSLLIRLFKDDLTVDLDGRDNVVGIAHRRLPVDACHAPLDSLDEDARAWVRLQLDIKEIYKRDTADRPRAPTERAPDTSELGLGRAALEAYDYPLAREHFERAFAETQGSAQAGAPLLELLVDTLAADEDAWALKTRLAPGAFQHALVRGLLALAAARTGRHDEVLALALEGEGHAAQALVVLADRAIADADAATAMVRVGQIEKLDPANPDLARLRDAASRVRTQAREPLERELARALEGGDTTAAENLARRILAQWPESAPARRALKQIEQRQREARVLSLLERAMQARTRGELDAALALLHEAQREAPERADVRAQSEEVEAAARVAREAASVAEVERLLRAQSEEGLVAYADLAPPLRSRVVEPDSHALRTRLDALSVDKGRARVVARALLALADAEAHASDSLRALATVGAHRGVLEALPEAGILIAGWEAKQVEVRQAEARATLVSAASAVEAGQYEAARKLLALVPRDDPQAIALLARIEKVGGHQRLLASLARLEAEQRPLEAREVARELEQAAPSAEQAQWAEKRRALDRKVRERYRLRVETLRGNEPEGSLSRRAEGFSGQDEAYIVVTAEGHVLQVRASGRWLFIEEIDVASQQVRRQVSLVANFDFGRCACAGALDGECLWVVSAEGDVLALAVADWEIRRASSLRAVLPSAALLESVQVPPGGRFLWVDSTSLGKAGSQATAIVEVSSWRAVRSPTGFWTTILPLADEPVIAVADLKAGGSFHAPSGASSKRLGSLVSSWRYEAVSAHPDGQRWVALIADPAVAGDAGLEGELGLLLSGAAAPAWVTGSAAAQPNALATGREGGLIAARMVVASETVVIAWDGEGREQYRVPVSSDLTLAQDSEGRRVVALSPTATGWEARLLGKAKPKLEGRPENIARVQLPLTVPFRCGVLNLDSGQTPEQIQEHFKTERRRVEETGDTNFNLDPLDMVRTLVGAYHETVGDLPEGKEERWQSMVGTFASAGIVRLYQAQEAVSEQRWDDLAPLLEGVHLAQLRPEELCHLNHLRGVVRFRAGDFAGAVAAWKEGLSLDVEGRCQLATLIAIAQSLSSKPAAHPFGAALAEAEKHRGRGNMAKARAALDRPLIWRRRELQSIARLVDAYLAELPTDPAARFRMSKALALYLELRADQRNRTEQVPNLPLADRWDETRLAEVEQRAAAWLESLSRSPT